MLDGAAKITPLFKEAERLGMTAVGMTDHGNMFGASEFYNSAKKQGIKPIIGIEAYIAPGSRFDTKRVQWGDPSQKGDDVSGSGAYTHMTMVAENATGLRNLFKLSSLASLEGQLGKWSRMDEEIIAQYAEGIIATTGCPSGEVQTRLRLGQEREALEAAAKWQEIFGKENFFLEVMDHGLSIETRVRQGLLEVGRKLGIPPLATNDCHYVHESDSTNHEALLCIQTGKTLSDPTRFKFDGSGYYLKSADEMRAIWDAEVPNACDNTVLIGERVQSYEEVWQHRDRMPIFPVPEGYDQASWLREEVRRGLLRRFPDGPPQKYIDQVEYEIGVILEMGFPAYFLVVGDLINHAREVGIRVGPGRGSAAGSLVAYALGITNIDPLPHGLLFERFLNPERVVDARYQYRLRRSPPRRDGPLRLGEVRRGQGGAGHHLRHHQDQGRDQGFGARAASGSQVSRSPTRSPRRCRRRSWPRTSRSPASPIPSTSATGGRGGPRPRRVRSRESRRSTRPPRASRA